MEVASWNNWVQRIDGCSVSEIDSEIFAVEADDSTPFVEKNLKLGYLYYSKDYLATATTVFKGLADKIRAEAKNFDFIRENEKGLNILHMAWYIEPDGCGGYDIFEHEGCCGGDECGCICGCIGIAAVMSVCGIEADAISDCDTTDNQGCCDNGLNSCGGFCDYWCGDGQCCCN